MAGKQLLRYAIIGGGVLALVLSAGLSVFFHDKDIFCGTAIGVAVVGIFSVVGEVWY